MIDSEASTGGFSRTYGYKRGIEHGNPDFNTRFRVNAPEASLLPGVRDRVEARGNGMLQILMEENLAQLTGATLDCEIWGGHPGTEAKRVSVNGRSTYALPEVGTAAGHCTHQYPTIPLQLTDLVNGYNVFQFACDQGTSFWGHFIVDNASLNAILKPDHPLLKATGLDGFRAWVEVSERTGSRAGEERMLHLNSTDPSMIAQVHFIGYYKGYDENGNALGRDWHGFTKARMPTAILGTATKPPFTITWDTGMLPDQQEVRVRARVIFKNRPDLYFDTAVADVPAIPERPAIVTLEPAQDIPAPFWSRDGEARHCTIPLGMDPAGIERAQLHVVIWDGGCGTVDDPFSLNGEPIPVVGEGEHDVLYRVLEIDPQILQQGANEIVVVSNTAHHGIEILLPGPALIVRRGR